jgi:hypothetical protein
MNDVTYIKENRDRTRDTAIFTSTATSVPIGDLLGALRITPAEQRASAPQRDIERAVYGHIRALRALGRTRIDTAEIAQALDLPLKAVEQTLGNLAQKGVKIVR